MIIYNLIPFLILNINTESFFNIKKIISCSNWTNHDSLIGIGMEAEVGVFTTETKDNYCFEL